MLLTNAESSTERNIEPLDKFFAIPPWLCTDFPALYISRRTQVRQAPCYTPHSATMATLRRAVGLGKTRVFLCTRPFLVTPMHIGANFWKSRGMLITLHFKTHRSNYPCIIALNLNATKLTQYMNPCKKNTIIFYDVRSAYSLKFRGMLKFSYSVT